MRKIDFEQHDWIDYRPNTSQSPAELKQEFGFIEELLALLSGPYYSLQWPQLFTGRSDVVDGYTLYFYRPAEKTSRPEGWELWTFFPQVRDGFGKIYANWRKHRREHGAGFYLQLATLRNSSMYIEHRFVNLVWGIESLHRTLYPDAKGSLQRTENDSVTAYEIRWSTELEGEALVGEATERRNRTDAGGQDWRNF